MDNLTYIINNAVNLSSFAESGKLGQFLALLTGYEHIPHIHPWGEGVVPTIAFNHGDGPLRDVLKISTCAITLTLPVTYREYSKFAEMARNVLEHCADFSAY